MNIESVITALEDEKSRIESALSILGGKPTRRRGRRKLSVEARNRISAAQKKRWALRKKK